MTTRHEGKRSRIDDLPPLPPLLLVEVEVDRRSVGQTSLGVASLFLPSPVERILSHSFSKGEYFIYVKVFSSRSSSREDQVRFVTP